MSRDLLSVIKDIGTQLKTGDIGSLNEANARRVVVERILSALGWDPYNSAQFIAEYAASGRRVDYALHISGNPKIFIEVKRPGVADLERHQKQLLEYAFEQGVPLAVLTNCVVWWFYLPLSREVNWSERRFCIIDLDRGKPTKVRDQFVALLGKENVSSEQAIEHAQKMYNKLKRQETIESNMPQAWNKMISECDDELVQLIIKRTRSFCGFRPGKRVTENFLAEQGERLLLPVKRSKPSRTASSDRVQTSNTT